MKAIWMLVALLLAQPALAGNGAKSELSHAAGGAIIAGAITAISEDYWPERDRAWVGFTISSVAGVLGQWVEYNDGKNDKDEAALDAAFHVMGSAIGAYVTDNYILMPVVKPQASGDTYMGVTALVRF